MAESPTEYDMLTVRLTRAEMQDLSVLAQSRGYSRSELVRLLLRRGVRLSRQLAPKDTSAAVQRPSSQPSGAEGRLVNPVDESPA
jgi:hypothetical protein